MLRLSVVLLWATAAAYAAQTQNLDIVTVIRSRFAETTISSKVFNNKRTSDELKFQSILPKEAFITKFSLTIDGITYDGVIEEKEEAEKIFEALRAKNKTTGIVRTRDDSIKTFKTSVNVGPGKTVEFKLVYQQLLRRNRGVYLNRIILLGTQLTERLSINVFICETSTITNVTVPPVIAGDGSKVNPDVTIFKDDNFAHIEYLPSNSNDALIQALSGSGGSFAVEYSLSVVGAGEIVINDNYFMHFFDPNANEDQVITKAAARRIMFVLDSSGSMSGNKMQQVKTAMINIIDSMPQQDRFGIIDFDTNVRPWSFNGSTFSYATTAATASAVAFINRLNADSSTNIYGALDRAVKEFNTGNIVQCVNVACNLDVGDVDTVDASHNYIIFLTDGRGNGPPDRVLDNMNVVNRKRIAIHAIGFGTGVNVDFLKTLAAQNLGTWTQIFEDTNSALQIQDYLDELGFTTVDGGLSIAFPDVVQKIIQSDRSRMVEGGELITVGKFKNKDSFNSDDSFIITVDQTKKDQQNLTFTLSDEAPSCAAIPSSSLRKFGFKAFGIFEVNEVLRKMDAEIDEGKKEILKQEAIALSLKYQLVTPVTAMLVVTPKDREELEKEKAKAEAERLRKEKEEKEKQNPDKPKDHDVDGDVVDDDVESPPTTVEPTAETTTPDINGTDPWWSSNGDPHFIVHLSNDITACFNWGGGDGDIYNLLSDSKNEIIVNGKLTESDPGKVNSLYMTEIAVLLMKYSTAIMVKPRSVVVRDFAAVDKRNRDLVIPVTNTHPFETSIGRIRLAVSDVTTAHTVLNITIEDSVSFIINMHHADLSIPDHLDFVMSHTSGLADHITGVFGSFPKEARHGVAVASIDTIGMKHLLWFHDKLIPVELTAMDVPTVHHKVTCWFVRDAADILGHKMSYYQLNRMYDIPEYTIF